MVVFSNYRTQNTLCFQQTYAAPPVRCRTHRHGQTPLRPHRALRPLFFPDFPSFRASPADPAGTLRNRPAAALRSCTSRSPVPVPGDTEPGVPRDCPRSPVPLSCPQSRVHPPRDPGRAWGRGRSGCQGSARPGTGGEVLGRGRGSGGNDTGSGFPPDSTDIDRARTHGSVLEKSGLGLAHLPGEGYAESTGAQIVHSVPCPGNTPTAGVTQLSSSIRRAEQGPNCPTESSEHEILSYALTWVSLPDPGGSSRNDALRGFLPP